MIPTVAVPSSSCCASVRAILGLQDLELIQATVTQDPRMLTHYNPPQFSPSAVGGLSPRLQREPVEEESDVLARKRRSSCSSASPGFIANSSYCGIAGHLVFPFFGPPFLTPAA